ncbi:MAG: translation elongation factor Ts [Clostridia bacterium]
MAFTSKDVMELRRITNVGMMDCKHALTETDGDMDKAVEFLREKGMASAAKKAGRIASQGVVDSYIHMGGKIGVLVEVNCESDFVARSEQFKAFVHDIALQIAAANPKYITTAEVPQEEIEHEKEILKAQALNEEKPKPLKIIEKMVEGRIEKYYKEVCLMNQVFVKDQDKTVDMMLNEAVAKIGEKISIRRFVRYEMGEGLEKKVNDLANEVEEQIAKMQK